MVSRQFFSCERRACARLGLLSGVQRVSGRANAPERVPGRMYRWGWDSLRAQGGLVFPGVLRGDVSAPDWGRGDVGVDVGNVVFGVPGAQGLDVHSAAREGHDDGNCCASAVADVTADHVRVMRFDERVCGLDVDASVVPLDPQPGAVQAFLDHAGECGHVDGDGLLGATSIGRLGRDGSWAVGADLQLCACWYKFADDGAGLAGRFKAQSGAVFGVNCEGVAGAFVKQGDSSSPFGFAEVRHDWRDGVEVVGEAGAEQPSVDHQCSVDDGSLVALVFGKVDAVFDVQGFDFAAPVIPYAHAVATVNVKDVDGAALLDAFERRQEGGGTVNTGAGEGHRFDQEWHGAAGVIGGR